MARVAIVAVAVLVCLAATASAQSTFCEYYTNALFGNMNATNQYALVNSVVTRAFTGVGLTGQPGLYYSNLNGRFFNGTSYPNVDYLSAAQSAKLTALVGQLDRFFSLALGCRAAAAAFPWVPTASLRSLHAAMNINAATMTDFINQVAYSLVSFGVPLSLSNDADLYAVATELGLFNRYPSAAADTNSWQICSQSDCPYATGWKQVEVLNTTGAFASTTAALFGTVTNSAINITQGDYLNFVFPVGTIVVQAASATAITPMTGGIMTGMGNRTYTSQYNTAGTYYFYNNASASSNRLMVTVQALASSSTGSSFMSSSSTASMTSMTSMSSSGSATGIIITSSSTGSSMLGSSSSGSSMTGATGHSSTGASTAGHHSGATAVAASAASIVAVAVAVAALF